jgi:hypothetical protein
MGLKAPGHVVVLWGQESQTASCLSHSAGIEKPWALGVAFLALARAERGSALMPH